MATTESILRAARVAPEIFQLRPDYRALLLIVRGIPPGKSDETSESLLCEAEIMAKEELAKTPVTQLAHISAWRDAYKAFGAKPQKHRNSLEALTRRVEGGLPRVNRLTDIYNAISVKYQIPFGGEDLDKYNGAPALVRAKGTEELQVFSSGEPQIEKAAPGEPIWCDDTGITCRRWNWRQGPRTALDEASKNVLFIMDALNPMTDEVLLEAAKEMISILKTICPDIDASYRLVRREEST